MDRLARSCFVCWAFAEFDGAAPQSRVGRVSLKKRSAAGSATMAYDMVPEAGPINCETSSAIFQDGQGRPMECITELSPPLWDLPLVIGAPDELHREFFQLTKPSATSNVWTGS